jgi:hypothetical protein
MNIPGLPSNDPQYHGFASGSCRWHCNILKTGFMAATWAHLMGARSGCREAALVLGAACVAAGLGKGGADKVASPEPSEAVLHDAFGHGLCILPSLERRRVAVSNASPGPPYVVASNSLTDDRC